MLALATSIKIRAKIDEKLHVFRDIVFGSIFGGFGEGFRKPKSLIFHFFSIKIDIKVAIAKNNDNKHDALSQPPPARRPTPCPKSPMMVFWLHFIEKQAPRLGGKQILAFWPRPQALELRSITFSNTPMA